MYVALPADDPTADQLSQEERAYVAKGAGNYVSYVARFRADGNHW